MPKSTKTRIFARLAILRVKRQLLFCIIAAVLLAITRFQIKEPLDDKTLFDLLKSFLEMNGVLLGFVVTFFLFSSQSNQSNKQIWFLEYRRSVNELFDIYIKLADEKSPIAEHLRPAIEALDHTSINNIPIHESARKEMVEVATKIANFRKRKSQLVGRHILSHLLRIENSLNSLGLNTIGVVLTRLFLDSIKKMAVQIVFIFLVLILWKFLYTNLSVYIIFFFFILVGLLTCGSFAELVVHLSDHYRESLETEVEDEIQEIETADSENR